MDALIPQRVFERGVEVIGLCNLNLYTQKTIAICLRVGDVANKLPVVNSTWTFFRIHDQSFYIINLHTPSKLSIHLCTTGVGDRFERDTKYFLANDTFREKVISNGRDNGIFVRRQSAYILECVR